MARKARRYRSDQIEVTYDARRCIHAAECVRGLPTVFDTSERPWIQPGNAPASEVAEVVMRCPTGALHFEGAAEHAAPVPTSNHVRVTANGPLYVRGDVTLELDDESMHDTRVALCRCGHSANKPFCDGTHREAGFKDVGKVESDTLAEAALSGPLTITPASNGPLLLRGNFELLDAAGEPFFRGTKARLCRCGGSGNKPFCDGTHASNDFTTAPS